MPTIKKILYLTYDGISDPLGMSQVLSYMEIISKKNKYKIHIFSFEKKNKLQRYLKIISSKKFHNINFDYTFFAKNKINKILKLLISIIQVNIIIKKKNIELIHCRGFFSSLILFPSIIFSNKKFLYDYRSFPIEEWQEIGSLKNKFLIFFLQYIDNLMIKRADHINVLVNQAKIYFNDKMHKNNFSVIPTCSSIKAINEDEFVYKDNNLNFVYVGGVKDPYQLEKIFTFFKFVLLCSPKSNLTIINENEHLYINEFINKYNFKKKIIIKSIDNENLKSELVNYDVGLLFLKITKSRKMCCPTKIGEYVSCGLALVCNKGVDFIDKELTKYKTIFSLENLDIYTVRNLLEDITKLKKEKKIKKESICIHNNFFDLEKGSNNFMKAYDNLLNK